MEDKAAVEATYRELLDYLNARGTRLSWPLDLRWAGSDFQRRVLAATAQLPYGAITSYAGIARRIGAPASVRAVAQALRHNPIPIAIPCHRVIGSGGDLTGYAGSKIGLKERLLSLEGVPVGLRAHRIERGHMYILFDGLHRVLPADVRLAVAGADGPAHALRLAPARRGCRSHSLHGCRPDLHPLSA